MKTIKFNEHDVDKIVDSLKNNNVIATRTDTVMGLMSRSDSTNAKLKLMMVKQRPEEKLFPIMVSSIEMMESVANLTDRDRKIVKHFLPGQLTVILNLKEKTGIKLESKTAAVRIVEDETLIDVVDKLGKPIFLTSANKSGQSPTMLASEVLEIFDGDIAGVIMSDAYGYQASTIVDLSGDTIKILREGNISLEEILEVEKEN